MDEFILDAVENDFSSDTSTDTTHHVLSLSGGKDSTALAFYIRDHMPEIHKKIEYIFCDTECELPETYEYLDKIEVFLDKKITRLKPYQSFEHLLDIYGFLPSHYRRWCTVELKTKPFRKYINDKFVKKGCIVNMYIGIRSDESQRASADKSEGEFIKAIFPFVESGFNEKDIHNILEQNGIGLPDYYSWSKRSGCYFCFFQSKNTWLNLNETHPDLFKKAKAFEDKRNEDTSYKKVSWNPDMTLEDMIKPKNIKKIRENYEKIKERRLKKKQGLESNSLFDMDDEIQDACLMCHI